MTKGIDPRPPAEQVELTNEISGLLSGHSIQTGLHSLVALMAYGANEFFEDKDDEFEKFAVSVLDALRAARAAYRSRTATKQ